MRMLCIFQVLCLLQLPLFAAPLKFVQPDLALDAGFGEKTVVARFAFTNTTKQPVTIARAESECSCMTIRTKEGKWRYEPGESGEVEGTFEVGNYTGTVDKTIRLWFDGDPGDKPSHLLKVRVRIPELIHLEPKTVQWPVGGEAASQVVTLTFQGDKPVRIRGITSSNPNFSYTLKQLIEGKSYEIAVTCSSTKSKDMAVFKVETDSGTEGQRMAQFFAVVR